MKHLRSREARFPHSFHHRLIPSLTGFRLTFCEAPQLLGPEDAGGRDGVVADDPVVRVVHEARHCKERREEAQFYRLHSTRRAPSQTAKPRRPTDQAFSEREEE